ncbi:DUF4136 domain-containing protein [Echinicola jeungdonensis]|uniref:DUF4136 domain-containing protein n=1 Tax=Echinicola jeungdonensis TaxID=709343 RepID=A0ABV5J4M0_9BACT|nr:DUF4136 domain-containing protein [Echinicola jeungdonensis]MDN3670695.1 DUF4136 domain-containing protein [Echinicola jeungdonensis]
MKRLKIIIPFIFLTLIIVGCSVTSSVVTDYDREANLREYQSYYWSDEFQLNKGQYDEPLFYNTLIKKRLKTAIEEEMRARGYELDPENPDLLIDSRVMVNQRSTSQNPYPISPYYNPYYYGYFGSQSSTMEKEGGIVVNLVDREERQLVWQGYVANVFQTETKDKQKEIREAIAKIFAAYEFRAR